MRASSNASFIPFAKRKGNQHYIILVEFTYFNWIGFPLSFMTVSFVIQILSWFLAGLAIAKLAKCPKK